jgi:hypothetical protein
MTGDDISHRHGFKETQATDEAIAAAMMSITTEMMPGLPAHYTTHQLIAWEASTFPATTAAG